MKRRDFVFVTLAAPTLAALSGVSGGCGSGSGGSAQRSSGRGRGQFTLTFRWPERTSSTRLIPAFTRVIVVTLTAADGTVLGTRQILADDGPPRVSTETFSDLAPGQVTLTATAFPNGDGTGVPLAGGMVGASIQSGETTRVTLTMGSTIDRIEVTPENPSVQVGQRVRLMATPRDAQGNVVLAPGSNFAWVSGSPDIAAPFPEGGQAIEAVGAGIGSALFTVTESDSGKSGSTTVNVGQVQADHFENTQFVSMAIDSTGRFAYVSNLGSFTGAGTDGDIRQFSVGGTDGALNPLPFDPIAAGKNPASIAAHPSAPFVYAVNVGDNTLSQYRVTESGSLTPLSPGSVDLALTVSGTSPIAVVVDPAGKFVFVVSHYQTVTSLRINGDGTLTPINTAGVNAFPYGLFVTPPNANGQFVYTVSRGAGSSFSPSGVSALRVDADGMLSFTTPASLPTLGTGSFAVATDPSGSFLYIHETGIHQYRINPDGGLTSLGAPVPTGPGPVNVRVPGPNPLSLFANPLGGALYTLNPGDHTISQYRISTGDNPGSLTPMSPPTVAAPDGAFFLKIHPNGKFAFVGGSFQVGTTGLETRSFLSTYRVEEGGALTPL